MGPKVINCRNYIQWESFFHFCLRYSLFLGCFQVVFWPCLTPPNIQSTLFEILTSAVILYKVPNASDIYATVFIVKKWSKLSQKTGSLARFERFFNFTLLHPDKLHTPVFCQIKHLMLWRGRYIHNFGKSLFSICSCQVTNF